MKISKLLFLIALSSVIFSIVLYLVYFLTGYNQVWEGVYVGIFNGLIVLFCGFGSLILRIIEV